MLDVKLIRYIEELFSRYHTDSIFKEKIDSIYEELIGYPIKFIGYEKSRLFPVSREDNEICRLVKVLYVNHKEHCVDVLTCDEDKFYNVIILQIVYLNCVGTTIGIRTDDSSRYSGLFNYTKSILRLELSPIVTEKVLFKNLGGMLSMTPYEYTDEEMKKFSVPTYSRLMNNALTKESRLKLKRVVKSILDKKIKLVLGKEANNVEYIIIRSWIRIVIGIRNRKK